MDMTLFVNEWLDRLIGPQAVSAGLLEHAANDPVVADRYSDGAIFMMANIGPQASSLDAADDVPRLYAVLAVYQMADYPGADQTMWDGCEAHARRASGHANAIGHTEVARRLRQDLIDRGRKTDPPGYAELKRRRMQRDPARGSRT